jgi:hypothetical protein
MAMEQSDETVVLHDDVGVIVINPVGAGDGLSKRLAGWPTACDLEAVHVLDW